MLGTDAVIYCWHERTHGNGSVILNLGLLNTGVTVWVYRWIEFVNRSVNKSVNNLSSSGNSDATGWLASSEFKVNSSKLKPWHRYDTIIGQHGGRSWSGRTTKLAHGRRGSQVEWGYGPSHLGRLISLRLLLSFLNTHQLKIKMIWFDL